MLNPPCILDRILRAIVAGAIVVIFAAACGRCGDNIPDPSETSTEAATAAAGVVLSPAKLFPPVFGFNPACIFPGTNADPGWFTAASVGGKLTVTGALLPGNNGTFTVTSYLAPGSAQGGQANPGNVRFTIPCTSETFPASAVVTWMAP